MTTPTTVSFPISTGAAARLLGCTEPRLAETVRRGKVRPPPHIFAGRRQWSARHLLQAAEALGAELQPEFRIELENQCLASETEKGGGS